MSEIVLETKKLTKYYGKRLALDHLDMKVQQGTIYGLLGRNGAGKTTAIKLLLGLMKPTSGSGSMLGCDCQELTPAIRQRIGYVTEGHRLFRWMKIGELGKYQKAFFDGDFNESLYDDMLDYFELSKKQKIKQLSNGQRAQVSLALAIAPNPEILIMDDPTLGLDAAIRRQFLEGMIQLIQKQGKTILFSSHILSDVERVADRVAVINKGVLRADCSLEEFRQAVKKVKFRFEKDPPQDVAIDGLLHKRFDHTEIELTLIGTSDEKIAQWASDNNAADFEQVKMNLEDQFIEYTEPVKNRRLFQWEVNE